MGLGSSGPNELNIALETGKEFDIDEALSIYTSKIYVKDWVGLKNKYGEKNCDHHLTADQTRKILYEYRKALLIIGKDVKKFKEGILKIEKELVKNGFYKAFALINGPCDMCSKKANVKRPSFDVMAIDILATIRRFKKNVPDSKEGELAPYAIVLVE